MSILHMFHCNLVEHLYVKALATMQGLYVLVGGVEGVGPETDNCTLSVLYSNVFHTCTY